MKLKSEERGIWFISDTHYGHKNITLGVSDWEDKTGCRDFQTVEQMNQEIIDGINDYVGPDDILFCLGDWSFGGINNIWKFRSRLNVAEIHLILGNHDTHIKNNKLLFKVNGPDVPAQELFSSVNDYLEISIDKKPIIMSHYPIISWNYIYKGSWHLHGHCHGTLFENEKSDHWYKKSNIFDVGIDTAFKTFGEYRPFSFKEIKRIMNRRGIMINDHHDRSE